MASTAFTPAVIQKYVSNFYAIEVVEKFKTELKSSVAIVLANKQRYLTIQKLTNVPWYFVAVLHMRESTFNFNKHLHNGDSLSRRTVLVPAGRPLLPPANGSSYTFEESCIDALKMKDFHKATDWSVAAMLVRIETYNGTGYIRNNRSNPYLWSGSQFYTGGKYIADGKYSSTAIDKQLGAGTLLFELMKNQNLLDVSLVKKKSNNLLNTAYNRSGISFFVDFFKS